MRNRFFLVLFLALGLMACSKSKPAYVGNTYEVVANGILKLTYHFQNEHEYRMDIGVIGYEETNQSYMFHCMDFVDEMDIINPPLRKSVEKFLDGCILLDADSIRDITDGDEHKYMSIVKFCEEYEKDAEVLKDLAFALLYNNKTNEFIIASQNDIVTLMTTKCINIANAEREKTGKASISTTIRSELPNLSGIRCPVKNVQKGKTDSKTAVASMVRSTDDQNEVVEDDQDGDIIGEEDIAEEPVAVFDDEQYCLDLLRQFYTASKSTIDANGGSNHYQTRRFLEYSACMIRPLVDLGEDYDIGEGNIKVKKVEQVEGHDNIYEIYYYGDSWGRMDGSTIVEMNLEDGQWKIDNVYVQYEDGKYYLMIDYTKPADFYYTCPMCGDC